MSPNQPPRPAQAFPPPPPPPGWLGSANAGLALTQGNSDTSTVNLAYEVKRDAGANLLFKSTGLFIRGESEGELITDRTKLELLDPYKDKPRSDTVVKNDVAVLLSFVYRFN